MSALQGFLNQVFHAYREYTWAEYASVGAGVLLYYDYALTFDDEKECIWPARWSPMKILFFLNRYLNILSRTFVILTAYYPERPSRQFCFASIGIILPISGTLEIMIAELILCIRLYALYGSKKVLYRIVALWAITSAASCVILGVVIHRSTGTVEPLPGVYGCFVENISILWAYWIPFLVFDFVAFVANAIKVMQIRNDLRCLGSSSRTMPPLNVMLQGSVIYYVMSLCIALTNLLIFRLGTAGIYALFQGLSNSLISVLMNRMIFSVQKVAHDREAELSEESSWIISFDHASMAQTESALAPRIFGSF